MPTLRIAQVAPLWASIPPRSYGGTERIVHFLTQDLVRLGHEVTLFSSADSHSPGKLHAVCERNLSDAMEQGDATEYEHYSVASMGEALARSGDFDLIHCHLSISHLPLARFARCPVVFTAHTPFSNDDRWSLARCPGVAVVCISEYQRSSAPHPARTRVIHHGIDLSEFDSSEVPGRYLAFLARMGPQKSPLDAIRIAQSAGMPIRLAGQPQNAAEEVYFAEQIRPLINDADVIYLGPVEGARKTDLLKNAAALLFPIQAPEAFGISMIEAMACGTPVLGTSGYSVPEIVDVGVTGYHAEGVEALAALVPAAVGLDRKGVRCRAEQRFAARRMTLDYLRFFGELLGRDLTAGAGTR